MDREERRVEALESGLEALRLDQGQAAELRA